MKDVIIKITDIHDNAGEKDGSELITTGSFSGSRDSYSLVYTEQDEELKSSVTTLSVENGKRIQMTRTGPYTTEMIMEKNKRHSCHYVTPFGEFLMGIYLNSIDSDIADGSGELKFKYTIDFNAANTSLNEMKITFKEAPGNVTLS